MVQLHKRFSDEQIVFLLEAYEQGLMNREEVQETLDIKRARFFTLWKQYREDPEEFSTSYRRTTPKKISPASEEAIENALMREKSLIEDPEIPISGFNYSALRDRLLKRGSMSPSTRSSIGPRNWAVTNHANKRRPMTERS